MENIENINNENNTEKPFGTKVLDAIKTGWRKARGPIIGGLIGFVIGGVAASATGFNVKDAVAGKDEGEKPVEDVPFDEDK